MPLVFQEFPDLRSEPERNETEIGAHRIGHVNYVVRGEEAHWLTSNVNSLGIRLLILAIRLLRWLDSKQRVAIRLERGRPGSVSQKLL